MDTTTIRVDETVADELADRKGRGDTYNDVLRRVLDLDQSTGPSDQTAEQLLRDLDLPGTGELQEERINAILELYDQLQDEPDTPISTEELKESIDADAVGYETVNSFWKNCLVGSGDRANALVALPGIEQLGNGRYKFSESSDSDQSLEYI